MGLALVVGKPVTIEKLPLAKSENEIYCFPVLDLNNDYAIPEVPLIGILLLCLQ